MKKHISHAPPLSIPTWEALEGWIRDEIEVRIQSIAGEEVTQFLGRGWYERKGVVDAAPGYRNGYGKPRRLSTCCGTIKIKRPRVRGLKERFESRILPLFARRTKEVGALLPELYLHGLAQGDFELALRGLLGDGAPLSSSSIARLRGQWETDYQTWQERRLDDRELVYAWADDIYVKAGLEKDKACLLIVIGATSDGRKEVLAMVPGYREFTESWLEVLRGLRDRGLSPPALVVADGNMGIWSAVNQVWPQTRQQRCWNHKVLNVVNQIHKRQQVQARALLVQIPYANTLTDAGKLRKKFIARSGPITLSNSLGRITGPLRQPGPASDTVENPGRHVRALFAFDDQHRPSVAGQRLDAVRKAMPGHAMRPRLAVASAGIGRVDRQGNDRFARNRSPSGSQQG